MNDRSTSAGRAAAASALALLLLAPAAQAQPPNPLQPLVDAAVSRLQVAEPVAADKFRTRGAVEDPARERQVLDAVAAQARERGVDPAYVTAAFRDQIDATVAVEYTRLAQWKLDPATAPTDAPDLASSRATIDGLNRQMVGEMAAQWTALHSPSCPADVAAAVSAALLARGLDGIYRQAADHATGRYCG